MVQVVLDASVIAKLFLDEELSDIAIKIKDDHISGKIEIVLPSLAKYGLMNALKSKNFSKEEIKQAIEAIKDYGIYIAELDDKTINKTAELSVDYDITAYDAAYVALANELNSLMYTADRKSLLSKVKDLEFVKHLSKYNV